MAYHPFTLAFTDDRMEKQFLAGYVLDSLWRTRIAAIASGLVFLIYVLFVSDVIHPEHTNMIWTLIVIELLGSCLYIALTFHRAFLRYFDHFTVAYAFFFGLGCFSPMIFAESSAGYYYVYLTLSISTIFVLVGTRFIHSLAVVINLIVIALVVAVSRGQVTEITIVTANFIILTSTVFAAIGGYLIELGFRRTFLDKHALQLAIDALEQRKDELKELSNKDSLTGLYNRRFFNDVFPLRCETSKRHGGTLMFLLLDIDFFKNYNDTYGHPAGDAALRDVAHSLKKTLKRISDNVSRIGGEEFAVIVEGMDREAVEMMAANIVANIEALKIEHNSSMVSDYVTISVGVTLVAPDKMTQSETIYDFVDKLLYQAKSAGRNQYCFAMME
ncbi:MAG: hypothetical protein AUJ57_06620 [Zetaproteobacteria bacterium CG1_02_53_45]|nr:MAG: hypothetical protein AUJ57_06620 [Zetaproteobacteria bacterium CG1_02_53_45]